MRGIKYKKINQNIWKYIKLDIRVSNHFSETDNNFNNIVFLRLILYLLLVVNKRDELLKDWEDNTFISTCNITQQDGDHEIYIECTDYSFFPVHSSGHNECSIHTRNIGHNLFSQLTSRCA